MPVPARSAPVARAVAEEPLLGGEAHLGELPGALAHQVQIERGAQHAGVGGHGIAGGASEEAIDGKPRRLAPDVPERGFDPPIAPAEVGDLAQALLHQGDVTGVFAQEIWTEESAEAGPLTPDGGAGAIALDAVIGGDSVFEGQVVDGGNLLGRVR